MSWWLLALGCGGGAVDLDTGWPELPVCINEFMPDNESALEGDDGLWPDWIEVHNPGGAPVDLTGWTVTDDREEPDQVVLEDLEIEAGGFLVLLADGSDRGGEHLPFALAKDGGDLGLFDPDGQGAIIAYGLVEDDFAVARVPDCCLGEGCLVFDFLGTPGRSNVPVVTEEVDVLPARSTWRYHTGSEPSGWREPGFDDGSWSTGVAPLGYGDSHQRTVISYGPDPDAKYLTTWFRLAFEVPDLGQVEDLRLELLRDDGAVVWLDGAEVARDNMPAGEVDPTTLAVSAVGGSDETAMHRHALDLALLPRGEHVLAVEVHQAAPNSSDLGFDLAIVAEVVVY